MSKHILELCLSPNLGGLELFSYHCYSNFKEHGKCTIALDRDTKLDKYFNSNDKLYIKRSKIFPFIPALKLAKYIDENNIDIIHFHWTKDIITAVMAKLLSKKKPKVIQSRHMTMTRFKDDVYHKWIYKNLDMIHAVTSQVAQQLKKFIPEDIRPKIELVYLGAKIQKAVEVDFLKEKYVLKDEFIVGIIGRIQDGKNQHIVIEAMSKLRDLNVKLFIVGDSMGDEYLEELHLMCKDFGIQNRVIFTGFTKDIDSFMKLCDVTIIATKNETFGLVVIESMANKTPVIARNSGGPLEIIDDQIDGMFYDGSSDSLAQKIELLYNDKNLIEKISNKAFAKVEEKFEFYKQLNKLYGVISAS